MCLIYVRTMSFKGKVVVITGGNSGIGRAVALCFASRGAHVIVGARRSADCEDTVRLVHDRGGQALYVQTDVTQSCQIYRLIETAVERWNRLDFAFNNAGIEGRLMWQLPNIQSRYGMR